MAIKIKGMANFYISTISPLLLKTRKFAFHEKGEKKESVCLEGPFSAYEALDPLKSLLARNERGKLAEKRDSLEI